MRQTFYKTLQGHKLEFNRLLYPVRYCVSTKDSEIAGKKFLLTRDDTNVWQVKNREDLPNWFNEISTDVHNAISDNEFSGNEDRLTTQNHTGRRLQF